MFCMVIETAGLSYTNRRQRFQCYCLRHIVLFETKIVQTRAGAMLIRYLDETSSFWNFLMFILSIFGWIVNGCQSKSYDIFCLVSLKRRGDGRQPEIAHHFDKKKGKWVRVLTTMDGPILSHYSYEFRSNFILKFTRTHLKLE